jgi:putative (di)nucleoside polyphosphate hydrolase
MPNHHQKAGIEVVVVVDKDGFRPNVGIILTNQDGNLLWARRVGGQDAWQFPQGGIQRSEKPEDALFRELEEEVGLIEEDVRVLGCTRGWLRYRLPKRMQRPRKDGKTCIGQKQKWFMLEMLADESAVSFSNGDEPPEFDHWRWVSYWYPVNQVVNFKRNVYCKALKELAVLQQELQSKN